MTPCSQLRELSGRTQALETMDNKPRCIMITGRPGAGKTTLSQALGPQLRMPIISRDEIKEGYVNTFGMRHDQLPVTVNRIVTSLFFDLVRIYLAGKVSVIIEAASSTECGNMDCRRLWRSVIRASLFARLMKRWRQNGISKGVRPIHRGYIIMEMPVICTRATMCHLTSMC